MLQADKAALGSNDSQILKISNLRAEFTTFNTGGSLITTPKSDDPTTTNFPNRLGFDHMQSYFVGVEGNPSSNMKANVNFNILGRFESIKFGICQNRSQKNFEMTVLSASPANTFALISIFSIIL